MMKGYVRRGPRGSLRNRRKRRLSNDSSSESDCSFGSDYRRKGRVCSSSSGDLRRARVSSEEVVVLKKKPKPCPEIEFVRIPHSRRACSEEREETVQDSSEENLRAKKSDDHKFLLSVLPAMKTLSDIEKMSAKVEIINALQKATAASYGKFHTRFNNRFESLQNIKRAYEDLCLNLNKPDTF